MNILIEPEFPALDTLEPRLKELGYTLLKADCNPQEINFYAGSHVFERYSKQDLTQLKFVQLASAGFDRLNLNDFKENNTLLANARDVYSIPIAEFVIARLLEVNKQLKEIQVDQVNQIWNKRSVLVEFSGQRALILGTGSIGTEIAKRLISFNVEIDGTNSDGRPVDGYNACFPLTQLKEIIGHYDYIINALPLNDSTYHCLNQEVFKYVKKDAVLVNIGRGPTVDEEALVRVLDSTFRAVILDVFEQEPLDLDSPLWTHPKSYISAHTSFGSSHYLSRLQAILLHNAKALKDNTAFINLIK